MASLEEAVLKTAAPGAPEKERKLSRREEKQKEHVTNVAAAMYSDAAEQIKAMQAANPDAEGNTASAGETAPQAAAGTVDPRTFAAWPPLAPEGEGEESKGKVHSNSTGPLTSAFQECMPIRAKTALVSA